MQTILILELQYYLQMDGGGNKIMNVGLRLANTILYDCTGNVKEPIYVDSEGNGIFYVNDGSVSVYIKKDISISVGLPKI